MPSETHKDLNRLLDRFRGTLLGLAIGDALGARVEATLGRDRGRIPEMARGQTRSDHMVMMVATARSLIEVRGFREEHMSDTLAEQVRTTYGDDVARRVFEDGDEVVDGAASFGNGAAVRAAPVGLLFHRDPDRAATTAADAAWITHAHPLGVDGAALQAAAVAELVQSQVLEPADLLERLAASVRTKWFRERLDRWDDLSGSVATTAQVLGNGVEAHRSVPTALYCFLQNRHSIRDALRFALSLGGDIRALASMTGALAGAWLGSRRIPAVWLDLLEGKDELVELAEGLLRVSESLA